MYSFLISLHLFDLDSSSRELYLRLRVSRWPRMTRVGVKPYCCLNSASHWLPYSHRHSILASLLLSPLHCVGQVVSTLPGYLFALVSSSVEVSCCWGTGSPGSLSANLCLDTWFAGTCSSPCVVPLKYLSGPSLVPVRYLLKYQSSSSQAPVTHSWVTRTSPLPHLYSILSTIIRLFLIP